MKYEIILFDVDDTLFDFKKAESHALHNTFTQFGLPQGATEYKASYDEINGALWREAEEGHITSAQLRVERFKRLFTIHDLDFNPNAFSAAYLRYLGEGAFLMDGAVELCDMLSDCRLAIITNGIKEVQTSRIQLSPLRDVFEQVIISEEVGCQKPQAGIFDYAFTKLAISDKSKVLMVGDSLTSDIQGGNQYGIDTCWFNPAGKTNASGIQPTYEIKSLMELSNRVLSKRLVLNRTSAEIR
ncbi:MULTISPECIES: YjjG family noncanonical pyrimidine nucleotidase [Paenibacillus]|uniref:YjjG family noncanonical pyrimidine nucleotidase n=1 Tax=Paenibacillus TaxID=44249 RepID=UPI0008FB4583|nr:MULTISPECIES: YjjG family noncanonical pyrimidine nucleotidase [Paenibacillus]APB76031.1 noncanonical pyrimidine nucleotidase, YjjG family [Paenibacillus polymyxa]OMF74049.1 noncanonical pyrimidine nucleotidase, YjjG family [Paenibacillus peoriae]POR24678.1 noncanonical pyrimidine nucleotidase, YjjG family [Paenibacillus polymyxa]